MLRALELVLRLVVLLFLRDGLAVVTLMSPASFRDVSNMSGDELRT